MEVVIDTQTVGEAGFNTYLVRDLFGGTVGTMTVDRTVDASNIVGGIIGSEGILYLGSKQIRLDGKNKRIVISDGINDRILIGYQQGGF
jgi:hypothetical protein